MSGERPMMDKASEASLLDRVTVLEIAEGVSGPVCGLQLVELGATVIKVEPPGGDRTREWGPALAGGDSAIFEHLNRGKRSIVLDLETAEGWAGLEGILPTADVVVVQEDLPRRRARGPSWESLVGAYPHLVVCEIDDVGARGPLAGMAGSELICQALSGFPRYIGQSGGEPRRAGYEIAGAAAAMHAVQAVLACLFWRGRGGGGQVVRVSVLGALLSVKTILMAAQTDPDVWEGFHLNGPHWPADTGWQTKDGQVTFDFRTGQREEWVAFCRAVGLEGLVDDPDYADWRSTVHIGDRRHQYGEAYRQVFASMTSQEASDLINGLGGISMKFQDYAEMLAHPQVQALDPLISIPDAPPGAQRQIGAPFRLSATRVDRGLRRAPRLGEHTLEVLRDGRAGGAERRPAERGVRPSVPGGNGRAGILAGLKVLDASMGAVGPWAGALLGALGADVLKLDSPQGDFIHAVRPTQRGVCTTYLCMNLNKRGIVLNMKDEAERAKAHALARRADVFIENFRPGVADRIGLGYETLSALNPRLIYASGSGFGAVGPLVKVGATDPHIQAFSGSTSVNGEEGGLRERIRWYGHFDVTTSLVLVQGVLAALLERERIGRGQRVDVTMTQAAMALQRVRIAEHLGGGRPIPMGSGTTYLVPDQAFATQDRPVAVSATSRAQWRGLCAALGLGDLAEDPRFTTNPARIANREALIPILAKRFRTAPAGYWLRVLRAAGVPCSLFLTFNDFRYHIHHLENEFVVTLKTPHWGDLIVGGLPWRFSQTPASLRPGSAVGEHTREIVEGGWPPLRPAPASGR